MQNDESKNDQSKLMENVLKYLTCHRQCVLGTSFNDMPFVAKVYFYSLGNYELVFSTFPNSNKFKNIQKNNYVAIEVDDGSPGNCMHYQGIAEIITSEEETDRLRTYILTLDAPFRKFMERSDLQFIKIKPHTIYYTDYNKKLFHRDVIKFDDKMNVVEIKNEKIF